VIPVRTHLEFRTITAMHSFPLHLLLGLLAITPIAAQSTINPSSRHAYATNAGWIDFRPSGADGVVVGEGFLSGHAYAANLGWLDLGSGQPANGHRYSNGLAADFGVNLDPHGNLSGYAYSANVGWISFDWAAPGDPDRPRMSLRRGTFRGCAWSANVGWLRLDAAGLQTDSLHIDDIDSDGIGDIWEKANFGELEIASAESNFDHDRASDLQEYLAGTNPKNPAEYLAIVGAVIDRGETAVTLVFTTNESHQYRIDWSDNLHTWQPVGELGDFDPDPGTNTTKTFTLLAREKIFWRVTSIQPLTTTP